MPEYTIPISGVIKETFERDGGSIKGDDDFFSVARTTPLVADYDMSISALNHSRILNSNLPFMPKDVTPWFTAFRAYSK